MAPIYMTGWVEDSIVEDTNGHAFNHGSGGVIGSGIADYGHASEVARGWPQALGGLNRGVVGADLPQRIYVRWQSLVEPETYHTWIQVPREAREIMQTSTQRRCPKTPDQAARYMAVLYLGLAPGGIVQMWVRDECRKAVKVARVQAEVEPLGPSQGRTNGRYAYQVSERSARYIEQYGIPYGSW